MRRLDTALAVLVLAASCAPPEASPPPSGGPPPPAVVAPPEERPPPPSAPADPEELPAEPPPEGVDLPRGLGALPYAGGTVFRAWAPHAERISVAGDFARTEMARTAGGVFEADVPGARAGDRYTYTVERGGRTFERADPRAARVVSSRGASIVVDHAAYAWTSTAYARPAIDEAVLYELHVGTFNDAPGGKPGTWRSAIEKLDHLAELGVNMVEVMPPFEFPGDWSWGYNPAHPWAPESVYGTPEDMKAFVDAAHARGIGVLLDVVHNHWGPNDMALECFDGDCLGAKGIYFYTDQRGTTPWGPRPNYGVREVRDYILENTLSWVRDYRADGFRFDSVVNIRSAGEDGRSLLREINARVHQGSPRALMIAEDLQGDASVTDRAGLGFDTQWDPGFAWPISEQLINGSDAARSMAVVRDAILHTIGPRPHARVIFTDNHDLAANGRARLPELIWPGNAGSLFSRKRSTLGAVVMMTSPGVPMLFQGQEILEDGSFGDRDPIDWSKRAAHAGIFQLYRDLVRLRRTLPSLRSGAVKVHHVNDAAKVIAWRRGDDVVVVANFANRTFASYVVGFPAGGTWREVFDSDLAAYGPDYGTRALAEVTTTPSARDGEPHQGAVRLAPYSAVILAR